MTADELNATKLGDIVIRLANFLAAMATTGSFNSVQQIPTLLQIDNDLKDWVLSLPSYWKQQISHLRSSRQLLYNLLLQIQGFFHCVSLESISNSLLSGQSYPAHLLGAFSLCEPN
jgi:hypothetical protein